MSRGNPHPYLKKEFEYMRKASIAWYNGNAIISWFYDKLSKHYAKKYEKEFNSR